MNPNDKIFSEHDLVEACKNIGFDLSCGRCASQFFTGSAPYEHDVECKTVKSYAEVVQENITRAGRREQ